MSKKFEVFSGFPERTEYAYVSEDSYRIIKPGEIGGTDGLIPCLAITLCRPGEKSILAHITDYTEKEELMAENVTDTLLKEFKDVDPKTLESTLSGEGIILSKLKKSDIIRKKLNKYGIKIIGEDLGRGKSRLVFLHGGSGRVEVYRTSQF